MDMQPDPELSEAQREVDPDYWTAVLARFQVRQPAWLLVDSTAFFTFNRIAWHFDASNPLPMDSGFSVQQR